MSTEGGQVRRNLIFNILSLLANIAVGIFYTPYLVKMLGIAAYGVIPLALIINQYISVVTGSLTSALTRFYSIALQKEQKEEASQYLSTSIIVVLFIITLLALPLWYLVSNIESVFSIPEDLIVDAKLLFTYTIFSFFCSLFSSVFNITLYAFNRLDLMNVIKIIRVSGKLVFVVLLFTFLNTNIAYVGLANLVTEVILLLYSIVVFLKFSDGRVDLKLSNYNKVALQSLGMLAFWVIVQQLGDTAIYRIDNILVNMFWSSKESGILGAFTELGNYTMIVAGVVGSLFGPLILMAYSKEDHNTVVEMSLDNSLVVGVLVAVMIGVLSGFSPIILKVWLSEEFVKYDYWLVIKLALVPFYSAAGIFAFAARAWNKVRFPALMTVLLGCINLGLLYLLAFFSNGNLKSIPYMLGVALFFGIAQSYFLNGLYFSKLYPGTRNKVLLNALKIFLVQGCIILLGYMVTPKLETINSVIALVIVALLAVVCLVLSVFLALNKKQTNSLIGLVYKRK